MRRLPGVFIALAALPWSAQAATLRPETIRAWDRYVELTEARIRAHIESADRFLANECRHVVGEGDFCVLARETTEADGSRVEVPKGRVHHWLGSALVPRATLDEVLAWAQDYDRHQEVFDDVEKSRLISRNGDRFEIALRLKRTKVVTVRYDTEHVVSYRRIAARRAFSESRATRIAQIGGDSGFLWRLNTYWRFQEIDEGVIVECESVSLSRDIPIGLRLIVAPFLRSVPRESLKTALSGIRRGALKAGSGRLSSGGDARFRRGPARVEGLARLIEVDHQGRVIGWNRLPFPRFTIDLGPDRPLPERRRDQQVIDAHSEVLVEMSGAIVPPGVAAPFGVMESIAIDQAPAQEAGKGLPFRG
jgi:hypothetical protein